MFGDYLKAKTIILDAHKQKLDLYNSIRFADQSFKLSLLSEIKCLYEVAKLMQDAWDEEEKAFDTHYNTNSNPTSEKEIN